MPIHTYDLSDTQRMIAEYDTSCYTYEDIVGDSISLFSTKVARGYADISTGDLAEALARIRDTHYYDTDKMERAMGLYLTLNGKVWRNITLQGDSQGQWADVFVYTSEENAEAWIDDSIKSLRSWWRGDVYTIEHQTKVIYTNNDDPSDTIEKWHTEDSIGGYVFTDDYPFEMAVKDLL